MEYALLYVFSTIPQTLAAALGVLAAFVLYRLQSDSATLWKDAADLINQFGGRAETILCNPKATLGELLTNHKYEALLAEIEERYNAQGWPDGGTVYFFAHGRLKTSLRARREILAALKVAFWITAIVILLSVLVLCLTHAFHQYTELANAVLIGGLFGIVICLQLYWRLVKAALWGERVDRERKTMAMGAIKRLFENDDKSLSARIAYLWAPLVGSLVAIATHLFWDRLHSGAHTLGRCGALVTFLGGLSAYGGATRIWIRAGSLIRGVREVPYGIVGAFLGLSGTLLWGYGDQLRW